MNGLLQIDLSVLSTNLWLLKRLIRLVKKQVEERDNKREKKLQMMMVMVIKYVDGENSKKGGKLTFVRMTTVSMMIFRK